MTAKLGGVKNYDTDELARIGSAVEQARLDRGWGKEEAARAADISSITWKRVEDGLGVRAAKLRAVEIVLGWPSGSFDRIAAGLEPERPSGGVVTDNEDIERGIAYVRRFADDCRDAGVDARLVNEFLGLAFGLLAEAQRLGRGLSVVDDNVSDLVAADEQEQSISGEQGEPDTP